MQTLFNIQPTALQAEKLSEGERDCPFEKLADAMGFQEKRQGTSDGRILLVAELYFHRPTHRPGEDSRGDDGCQTSMVHGNRRPKSCRKCPFLANLRRQLAQMDTASELFQGSLSELRGTFDNAATTGEMRFLIRAYAATSEVAIRNGFLKALQLLLEAQYPSGGWPQTFPLEKGYSSHITFNDNTMGHILRLLLEVSQWESSNLVNRDHQRSCQKAFERGIECILRAQIKVKGVLTVWCAQHDPVNLEPRPARSDELES